MSLQSHAAAGVAASQVHGASGLARDYLSGWQRARAELANLRSRLERETNHFREQTRRDIFDRLMPLADNFDAMVKHVPAELADHAWTNGVLHIARQLDHLLAEQGINRIEALHQPFNPARHEAVAHVSQAGVKSGTVVEVLQSGYLLGDHVIRPAKVKVAK